VYSFSQETHLRGEERHLTRDIICYLPPNTSERALI